MLTVNCSIITLTSYKVHRQMSKVGFQVKEHFGNVFFTKSACSTRTLCRRAEWAVAAVSSCALRCSRRRCVAKEKKICDQLFPQELEELLVRVSKVFFVTGNRHCDKTQKTNNQVNLLQACSWAVRKQAFAKTWVGSFERKKSSKQYLTISLNPIGQKEYIWNKWKRSIECILGRLSNNQNGNLRWLLPWRGGSRGGLECHIPILKNDFLKNHLESFPDC